MEKDYNQILFEAALTDDIHTVAEALKNGANINARNREGRTALSEASKTASLKLIRFLLMNNADTELGAYSNNGTALQYAAHYNRHDVIELLLKYNAQLNAANKFGQSALTLALGKKNYAAAEVLITHGADIHLYGQDNKAPIDYIRKLPRELSQKLLNLADQAQLRQEPDRSPQYMAISDEELLVSQNYGAGLRTTTLINFQLRDVIRQQFNGAAAAPPIRTSFSEFDDPSALDFYVKKMKRLGKNPDTAHIQAAWVVRPQKPSAVLPKSKTG